MSLLRSAEELALGWPPAKALEKAVQRLRERLAKCEDPRRWGKLRDALAGCESALRDTRERERLVILMRGAKK